MDKVSLALIALLAILLLSQVWRSENFTDASDNSGATVTVSLADLIALIGAGTARPAAPAAQAPIILSHAPAPGLDSQFVSDLKASIQGDVKQAVRDELLSGSLASSGTADVLTDGCIDSLSAQQGSDWMRYVPGKNPADYVRKDSVPCYGCSLP